MCGICGAVYKDGGRPDRGTLKAANDLQSHRGPDDEGFYIDGPVGLAMRRLSIIDISTGHQPISYDGDGLWIVFNGEIYNYLALREELEARGHRFKTRSDTETILALYKEMGADCVQRLRGMFAFAIWDKSKRRLFIARDRIGKKPLVYTDQPGYFAFASELRCLFAWPGISREIDPAAVDQYLSLQYIPSPLTIYKSVKKLSPGHALFVEEGRVKTWRYWDLPLGEKSITEDPLEAQELIRNKLKEAVRLRLISEVPLGAFLSGGIDSSIVVALMSELSSSPVKTFSIGFEEEDFSELPFARQVAQRYGCDHREFIVKPEMADVLPKLAWHYGEPYADSSALPSYYVARETRKHVTVALNGDGGDENFAGYVRYFAMKAARLYDKTPAPLRSLLQSAAEYLPESKSVPVGLAWKIRRFLRSAVFTDLPRRHLKMVGYFSEEDKEGLYSSEFAARLNGSAASAQPYIAGHFARAQKEDFINSLLYVDFKSYLPECLMAKMDIATMANSLEGRSPFLDHEFVELVYRLPGHWKLKGLRGHKWILKEAFRDKLPPEIFNRPKMGFGIPVGQWFRGALKDFTREHLLGGEALSRGLFNPAAVQALWDQHQSRTRDHTYRLWALLMLEMWHKSCGVKRT